MALLLADRTAVVTGDASGFGRAIYLTFARNGADLIVADIRETPREGGPPTHERIRTETTRDAHYVACDVTNPDDLAVAVEAADELGGIDIMVTNAGIVHTTDFLDVTEAEYDRLMAVNVKGAFFGSQVAARHLLSNGGGSIINVSSVAGMVGTGDLVTYCTSKGTVRLLTYVLAERLGPGGVRVNAIHPGFDQTQMLEESELGDGDRGRARSALVKRQIPLRRFADSQEVAHAGLFLASELSSYVNGESVLVDGGLGNTR